MTKDKEPTEEENCAWTEENEECRLCSGEWCNLCAGNPGCDHDVIDRHESIKQEEQP